MKKYLLLGGLAVAALLLVIFGPTLLNLYRLQNYVSASAEAAQADAGPWPRTTEVCTTCHGVKGNSVNGNYPALAGQPAPYLAAQLQHFASGARVNPNMEPLAMTMKPAEVDALAAYFARQPALPNPYFKPDPQMSAKGEKLVEAGGCAACHGAQMTGQEQFPRLAGQGYEYLVRQLDAFAGGARTEATGTMQRLAAAASPDDRKAMAAYLANLPPSAK